LALKIIIETHIHYKTFLSAVATVVVITFGGVPLSISEFKLIIIYTPIVLLITTPEINVVAVRKVSPLNVVVAFAKLCDLGPVPVNSIFV
jgi:hypothetical protein